MNPTWFDRGKSSGGERLAVISLHECRPNPSLSERPPRYRCMGRRIVQRRIRLLTTKSTDARNQEARRIQNHYPKRLHDADAHKHRDVTRRPNWRQLKHGRLGSIRKQRRGGETSCRVSLALFHSMIYQFTRTSYRINNGTLLNNVTPGASRVAPPQLSAPWLYRTSTAFSQPLAPLAPRFVWASPTQLGMCRFRNGLEMPMVHFLQDGTNRG